MKRLALAIGFFLALGFSATTAALADFAVAMLKGRHLPGLARK